MKPPRKCFRPCQNPCRPLSAKSGAKFLNLETLRAEQSMRGTDTLQHDLIEAATYISLWNISRLRARLWSSNIDISVEIEFPWKKDKLAWELVVAIGSLIDLRWRGLTKAVDWPRRQMRAHQGMGFRGVMIDNENWTQEYLKWTLLGSNVEESIWWLQAFSVVYPKRKVEDESTSERNKADGILFWYKPKTKLLTEHQNFGGEDRRHVLDWLRWSMRTRHVLLMPRRHRIGCSQNFGIPLPLIGLIPSSDDVVCRYFTRLSISRSLSDSVVNGRRIYPPTSA